MVVYADILILVNFAVDYFLLAICRRFINKKARLWRMLLSAALGGVFSLYILLPQSKFLLQCMVQVAMCMVLCWAAFGFENVKSFLRNTLILFCVNFAYSGAMIAMWLLFKPHGMVINNSVIYFNVSPLFLVLFSVVGYFAVMVLRRLFKKNFSQNVYCDVTLFCNNSSLSLQAIIDTGNSISDVFGISQIFIVDQNVITSLLKTEIDNPARFRKVPCNTVTGEKLLDGYRIDYADVHCDKNKYRFKNPILAVSQTSLKDCQLIINPETLN